MCAYRCALRPALRTVSRLALRGCYKIGRSNFEPLARSYRPANRRTFTAGRYPVAGNYSLIHVLLRCVLTLWPCARPAGQSGKVRKQCPSFRAARIGVGAPFRKLRPRPSFRAVRLWAAVRLSFLPRRPHAGFGACAAEMPRSLELYSRKSKGPARPRADAADRLRRFPASLGNAWAKGSVSPSGLVQPLERVPRRSRGEN